MLNTQSRLAALLIWLTIAAICVRAAWTFFGLSAPGDVIAGLATSPAASLAVRHQGLVAGLAALAGLSALALAYLFNGWRDRAERRHVIERAERRLADVMAREASHLAGGLQAAMAAPGVAAMRAQIADLADPHDSVLLSLPMTEVAHLGSGASAAIRALRRHARQLASAVEGRDESAGRQVGHQAIETALAARDAARVLATLVAKGTAAADALKLPPPSEAEVAEMVRGLGDGPVSTRLLPAA